MERNQKPDYQIEHEQAVSEAAPEKQNIPIEKNEEDSAEIEVVRSSTPRPLSLEGLLSGGGYIQPSQAGEASAFPAKAPSAPPVPEELNEEEEEAEEEENVTSITTPFPTPAQPLLSEEVLEFTWLFEYGEEMDPALLNRPERLDGLALLYGPARLKGYTLMIGKPQEEDAGIAATIAIVPDEEADAEVWGVLYRIPGRLQEQSEEEPSLLDSVHSAILPQKYFQGVEVAVHETYREREINTITYVASEMAVQQLQLVATGQWSGDMQVLHRLAEIARKQKLPESYITRLLARPAPQEQEQAAAVEKVPETQENTNPSTNVEPESALPEIPQAGQARPFLEVPPSVLPPSAPVGTSVGVYMRGEAGPIPQGGSYATDLLPAVKHDMLGNLPQTQVPEGLQVAGPRTEPLQAIQERRQEASEEKIQPRQEPTASTSAGRWLLGFSLYLSTLLLVVLTFAVLQGLGWARNVLTSSFMPLGVPWMVMVYGLLGGCLSCLITLSRMRDVVLPAFVIVTWFTRPFIGAVLASFAFLILTSGLFASGPFQGQQVPLFWLVGALAGLGEAYIFLRRRP